MSGFSVCSAKQHFDTEFEATRAAAIASYKYREEYIVYPCNNHWHLSHEDPHKRGRSIVMCHTCGEPVKRSRLKQHKCEVEI